MPRGELLGGHQDGVFIFRGVGCEYTVLDDGVRGSTGDETSKTPTHRLPTHPHAHTLRNPGPESPPTVICGNKLPEIMLQSLLHRLVARARQSAQNVSSRVVAHWPRHRPNSRRSNGGRPAKATTEQRSEERTACALFSSGEYEACRVRRCSTSSTLPSEARPAP